MKNNNLFFLNDYRWVGFVSVWGCYIQKYLQITQNKRFFDKLNEQQNKFLSYIKGGVYHYQTAI